LYSKELEPDDGLNSQGTYREVLNRYSKEERLREYANEPWYLTDKDGTRRPSLPPPAYRPYMEPILDPIAPFGQGSTTSSDAGLVTVDEGRLSALEKQVSSVNEGFQSVVSALSKLLGQRVV
jgi:hypothetical protein